MLPLMEGHGSDKMPRSGGGSARHKLDLHGHYHVESSIHRHEQV